MPHVIVKMYAGKTEEQKQALTDEIQKALTSAIGSAEKSISVAIEDVDPADWVEKVYRPDILDKPDLIYKKPGYDPFA
ncbi:tautomerase family protein [Neorhizobium sp. NPDC001467]|uniref:tautomerase family protein n=1 Tax=Neorhizobium sp. NPDC001467 TaxID=3390595 RepID=UPI003CFF2AEB